MKKPARKPVTPPAAPPAAKAASKNTVAGKAEHLNLNEIKELIELISEKQFNEFELERGDFRLRLQKGIPKEAYAALSSNAAALSSNAAAEQARTISNAHAPAAAPNDQVQPAPEPAAPVAEENLHVVTSPIVGTFYRSSSPTAEAFVKMGDSVEAGQTLCIIEAMKLMNEIPTDVSGSVAKIYVDNGQPVEYGQPLFGLKI
jgi:acetyl-CoA carboxylase biotin carboxyl carrier protein